METQLEIDRTCLECGATLKGRIDQQILRRHLPHQRWQPQEPRKSAADTRMYQPHPESAAAKLPGTISAAQPGQPIVQ